MARLHVAFFNRTFYPEIAATGQILTELCEDLVQKYNCQVSVVTGVPSANSSNGVHRPRGIGIVCREYHQEIEILRARGTTFSKRSFVGRFANYLSYFTSSCLVGLRLSKPDVVVALTDPPIIGLAALLAARRYGVPFVLLCQDVFPEVARLLEDFQSETVNHILDGINRFLLRRADRVIALGETMQARLTEEKGAAPDKMSVIPNWADCAQIIPADKRNPFSKAHKLEDPFVVMHSGNIGLSQNLEILLEAAELLKGVPDIQVILVGDGAKRDQLQQQAESRHLNNVRFLPFQPREGLTHSFATADVFVISLKKGLAGYIVPSKLYGILAAGRPYVAAVEEACEVSAVTRKYDCGLLVEPENPQGLADKILMLYRDREKAQRMGVNGRQVAQTYFDRKICVREYHELFTKLANGSQTADNRSRAMDR